MKPKVLIDSTLRETFAVTVAELDGKSRQRWDEMPKHIRDLCFAFYHHGFLEGGKLGAGMAYDRIDGLLAKLDGSEKA